MASQSVKQAGEVNAKVNDSQVGMVRQVKLVSRPVKVNVSQVGMVRQVGSAIWPVN